MKKAYYVQVNDYMTPVKVMLTDNEVDTVIYLLKEIAKNDKYALVDITDCDYYGESLYTNYDERSNTHEEKFN